MIDLDDVPLTTAEGRRPSSTGADRVMVGLAALALIGGGLIAISRLLPPSESPAVADATATPHASVAASSATPLPTPTPPPPLRSFALARGELPDATVGPAQYMGWARALQEVTIRPGAYSGDPIVLHAGDAAYLEEQPAARFTGLYQVHAPGPGWVPNGVDVEAAFELFPYQGSSTGWLADVVAGPDGFAVVGSSPAAGNHAELVIASSVDGTSWQVHEAPVVRDPIGMHLAHGPAGWLLTAMVFTENLPQAWMWRSDDLRSWEPLGRTGAITWREGGVTQLAGTDEGYLILARGALSGQGWAVWYSSDGVLWSERRPIENLHEYEQPTLIATPQGFYLQGEDFRGDPVAAFSGNGWDWTPVDTTPLGQVDQVIGLAPAADGLVAVDRSSESEARAWLGTISGVTLTWRADPSFGTAFAGSVVTSLVSDGTTPIAFGWERTTEAALWWVRAEEGWQRLTLPADYRGIPRQASGGPRGYLLAGSQPTSRGQNPVLWHYDGSGDWEPATNPVIAALPDPSPAECAGLGDDLLEIMGSNGTDRAACFGDASITFRAFAAACEKCGGALRGQWETAWLSRPTDRNLLYLAPTTTGDWGLLEGVLPPSLPKDARWEGRWLAVTGHYDDPGSGSCRWTPTLAYELSYTGRDDTVLECRGRLVIDSVRIVPGRA